MNSDLFGIRSTGQITVKDSSKLDFETQTSHTLNVTVADGKGHTVVAAITIHVLDVLEADHPAKWSWLIHSPYKIEMDTASNQFHCSSEKASALTSLLSSQAIHWELSDTFAIPAVN